MLGRTQDGRENTNKISTIESLLAPRTDESANTYVIEIAM
jgi:hypothetical protein